jgi:hypothetical protein
MERHAGSHAGLLIGLSRHPSEEVSMKTRSLLVAAFILVVAGCGAQVRSTVASGANLSQYRTYAFYTPAYRANRPESPGEQELRMSLRNSLAERGLTEVPAGIAPDFEVAYHVKKQQKLDIDTVGYGFWGWSPAANVTTYTEGTLIVDFIDPRTNTVFWRGTATDVLHHPESPDMARVDAAVAKLIRQYPSMMAATPRQAM